MAQNNWLSFYAVIRYISQLNEKLNKDDLFILQLFSFLVLIISHD